MKSRWLVAPVVASVAASVFVACGAQPGDDLQGSLPKESADATSPVVQITSDTIAKSTRPTRANGVPYGVKPRRDPEAVVAPIPLDQGGPELPPTTSGDGTGSGRFHDEVTPTCNNPKLTYFGGPLLQTPLIVPVFWSSSVNPQLIANMPQFFADVTVSSYWAWLTEYDSVGLAAPTSSQAILPGSATAGVTLTPSVCPGTANCTVTDAQIQTELSKQIVAGFLPAPVLDCTRNTRTVYMIEFPPNVKVTGPDGAGTSCVQFCAYHNTGTYGAGATPLVYGVLMDEFTAACKTGCGANATALENSTDTASHELVEAATDPDIGLDLQANYAAPAGWGDNNNQCGEIADICDQNVAGDTITVSGRTWSVQELWSNKQGKCTSTGTPLAVCSGTTTTNCRQCTCGDDGLACSGGTSVCETTSTNVLFGACEQCTATDTTACGTGACDQSTTPASDDICTCVPRTSCPAGDNCGTVSDGCTGSLNCGTCGAPQTCGGGTPAVPNVCGCTPATTCPAGDNCGTVPDGCGGTVNCGACATPQTCGGGTPANPNACGCTPKTSCPAGQTCGTAGDGCGGTLNCGTCATPLTCGGGGATGVCGCTPLVVCPAGDNCGSVPDGCGGTVDCGACAAPQTCGGGSPTSANQCGCTPVAACPAGQVCGVASDTCGGTIACGTCGAGQTCNASNQCVATVADAGVDSGGTVSDSGTHDSSTLDATGGHDASGTLDGAAADATAHKDAASTSGQDADEVRDARVEDAPTRKDSGSAPRKDGGGVVATVDAGPAPDGAPDAAGEVGQTGGCGCRTAQPTRGRAPSALLVLLPLALVARRRRHRNETETVGVPA